MPDEGNAARLAHHLVREGHRLPVQQRVDEVGLQFAQRAPPVVARQVAHVAEGQRADRVVPVGVRHPQPVQLVAALLEREHAIGVVGQLADQQDLQAVARARYCVSSSMKLPVVVWKRSGVLTR